jgi:hypothetical protein
MDCKAALEAAQGDLQGAVEYLRKKGLADAAKKSHRDARDGVVVSYIHPGSKIGVLVEVNCETHVPAAAELDQHLRQAIGNLLCSGRHTGTGNIYFCAVKTRYRDSARSNSPQQRDTGQSLTQVPDKHEVFPATTNPANSEVKNA